MTSKCSHVMAEGLGLCLWKEMSVDVNLEHVSVGCNRSPHCLDWSNDGLLAFGADKSIALATTSVSFIVRSYNCKFTVNYVLAPMWLIDKPLFALPTPFLQAGDCMALLDVAIRVVVVTVICRPITEVEWSGRYP